MHLLKAAALYFVLVFGAGFILGPIRILLLVPRFGTRVSELFEMPIMLVVIVLAARFVNQRFLQVNGLQRLLIGLAALAFLLTAEVGLGVALRGVSPIAVLFDRDPVSGTIYYLILGVFGQMPWLLYKVNL